MQVTELIRAKDALQIQRSKVTALGYQIDQLITAVESLINVEQFRVLNPNLQLEDDCDDDD